MQKVLESDCLLISAIHLDLLLSFWHLRNSIDHRPSYYAPDTESFSYVISFNHYSLLKWSQIVTCFTEKETEAQKGQVNSVMSHS